MSGKRPTRPAAAEPGWLLKATRSTLTAGRRHLFLSSWKEPPVNAGEDRLQEHWNRVEAEVVLSCVALGVLSWFAGPIWGLDIVLVLVAAIRFANILSFSLANVFFATEHAARGIISSRRTTLLTLINVGSIGFVFVIFDRSIAAWSWGSFIANGMPISASAWWPFAYLSWTTLLTMGSGFMPTEGIAQLAVMGELGIGLLMIAVTLGSLISSLPRR